MSEQLETLRSALAILALSLDFRTTLESLAKLAVSRVADWCGVFIIENGDTVRRLASARAGASDTGPESPEVVFPYDDGLEKRVLESLEAVSCHFFVPVCSGNRKVGVMAFASFDPARSFTDSDMVSACDLATAAAAAMENARLYNEIQEANRMKNEFVGMVSHELRTPLTPILGCVHLLRTAKLSETNFARALEMIERNAQAQVQIVEDLLDVSRMVAGKLKIAIKNVDPLPLVEEAVASVKSSADSKGVELESSLEPVEDPMEADPDRLKQVVWNLLSNAVKFTPTGGKIAVSMKAGNGVVEICVADTGIGIAGDALPYIFDRFKRADAPGEKTRSGLGLGLAIVRHLVELHQGSVTASSGGLGKGANFRVRLPLRARKAQTVKS